MVSVMFTPENYSERYFWHSFHDLTAIKSLKVEEYSLIGNDQVRDYPDYLIESKLLDILPSSLETLTIIHCNLWSIPKLLETADIHDYPLLRLKTATIKIRKLSDLQEFDHLQPAFARIGVEFRCIYASAYGFSSSESSEYDSTEELEEDSK